ncbi:MAG: tetratricopeptide repeat protein [Alphaproteobacteria bacterium]
MSETALKRIFLVTTAYFCLSTYAAFADDDICTTPPTYPVYASAITATYDVLPPETREKAEQGDVNAELVLGYFFLDSRSEVLPLKGQPSPDYAAAEKWLRKAGEQGDWRAVSGLAKIFSEGGYGVKQDYEEAYFWLGLASLHGAYGLNKDCKSVADKLRPEQRTQVAAKIRGWKPKTVSAKPPK